MYAYCENNPINMFDDEGTFLKSIIRTSQWVVDLAVKAAKLTKNLLKKTVNSIPDTAKEQIIASNTKSGSANTNPRYETLEEAAQGWANTYNSVSETNEHCAILYEVKERGEFKYTYGTTYQGNYEGVVPGFIRGYSNSLMPSKYKAAGYIHSHPSGSDIDFSAPDIFLLRLPQINQIYVTCYDNTTKMGVMYDNYVYGTVKY